MKSTFQKLRDWWKQQEDPMPVYVPAPPQPPVVKEDSQLKRLLEMRAQLVREVEELKARFVVENNRLAAFKVNDHFHWMGVDMYVGSVDKGEVFDVLSEADARLLYEQTDRHERPYLSPSDRVRSFLLPGSSYGSLRKSSPCVNLMYFAAGKGLCWHPVGATDFDALLKARSKGGAA